MQSYNHIWSVDDISNEDDLEGSGVLTSDFFPAPAGETQMTIEDLEGGTIMGMWIESDPYEQSESDTPGNKEYVRDSDDDTLFTFPTQFNSGAKVFVIWYTGSAPVSQTEPVTVAEMKEYMRLQGLIGEDDSLSEFDYDDTLIGSMIKAARMLFEKRNRISIVTKRLRAVITNCGGRQLIPDGPVNAISSFKDKSGNDITEYELIGSKFPKIKSPTEDDLVIEYVVGFTTVPDDLKLAIKKQVCWDYEHRGEEKDFEICKAADILAAAWDKSEYVA